MSFQIPYGRQNITQEDLDAVLSTLQSDFLTQGPKVEAFEIAFAKYLGVRYAVAVSNATAGLHISNLALGTSQGKRIITSPITFAASANSVRMAGGEVWLADIDPDTYLLDIKAVEKLISSKPRGFFSGIIPVDFGGLPINLEAFRKLTDKHGLWLIEDAAHAPGGYFIDSKEEKNMCGNGIYADCAVFSFHPVKHIACGEGGMVTTNSKELYEKLVMLRSHGITKNNMSQNDGGWYYEMQFLGYNYRLTDIQSTLGISQLKKNPQGLIRRNEIAKRYQDALGDIVKFQKVPLESYNAYHLFVIETEQRLNLYNFLKEKGIFSQIHYIPIHFLPYYKEIGYGDADLTHAENYYKQCISLPMFPSLTDEEINYVIAQVKTFFE